MFKPRATVAAIVHCHGEYLIVEETIDEKQMFNQPAGHLEDNESLVQAVSRELHEETGLRAEPDGLCSIALWRVDANKSFLRFNFFFDLKAKPDSLAPHDDDIDAVHWMTKAQLQQNKPQHRSHLLLDAIDDFEQGRRIPLANIKSFLSPR